MIHLLVQVQQKQHLLLVVLTLGRGGRASGSRNLSFITAAVDAHSQLVVYHKMKPSRHDMLTLGP